MKEFLVKHSFIFNLIYGRKITERIQRAVYNYMRMLRLNLAVIRRLRGKSKPKKRFLILDNVINYTRIGG